MPNDLRQRFEQLRREPLGVVLPGPEALRRVGTHRRRSRRIAAAGLAAVAVAVVAVTLNAVLPTPQGLTPPAATRTGAGETPGPTSSTAPTPTATSRPAAVPDAAFPTGGGIGPGDDIPGPAWGTFLPEVCGLVSSSVDGGIRELTETDDLVASRWRSFYIDVPGSAPESGLEGSMDVQVLLFAEGGASRFLDSLRAAVAACPSDPDAHWGPRTLAAVADGPEYGDETFAFMSSSQWPVRPDSAETYTCVEPYEVVRVGDAVHVADVSGWETCSADPELDRQLRDRAIQTFLDWATGR